MGNLWYCCSSGQAHVCDQNCTQVRPARRPGPLAFRPLPPPQPLLHAPAPAAHPSLVRHPLKCVSNSLSFCYKCSASSTTITTTSAACPSASSRAPRRPWPTWPGAGRALCAARIGAVESRRRAVFQVQVHHSAADELLPVVCVAFHEGPCRQPSPSLPCLAATAASSSLTPCWCTVQEAERRGGRAGAGSQAAAVGRLASRDAGAGAGAAGRGAAGAVAAAGAAGRDAAGAIAARLCVLAGSHAMLQRWASAPRALLCTPTLTLRQLGSCARHAPQGRAHLHTLAHMHTPPS